VIFGIVDFSFIEIGLLNYMAICISILNKKRFLKHIVIEYIL